MEKLISKQLCPSAKRNSLTWLAVYINLVFQECNHLTHESSEIFPLLQPHPASQRTSVKGQLRRCCQIQRTQHVLRRQTQAHNGSNVQWKISSIPSVTLNSSPQYLLNKRFWTSMGSSGAWLVPGRDILPPTRHSAVPRSALTSRLLWQQIDLLSNWRQLLPLANQLFCDCRNLSQVHYVRMRMYLCRQLGYIGVKMEVMWHDTPSHDPCRAKDTSRGQTKLMLCVYLATLSH